MAFDFASAIDEDFDLFDGTETVTYTRINRDRTETEYPGVKALKRATLGNYAGGTPGQVADRARWLVKASTLPIPPAYGDKITGASGTWEIVGDDVIGFGAIYRLETVKVVD